MTEKIRHSAHETMPGVFHANTWGQPLGDNLLEQLIEEAKINANHKARLCIHPTSEEKLQVTYLAFKRPYADKIHKHPYRPEVVIPILGEARHTLYDSEGKVLVSRNLDGRKPVAVSTQAEIWHSIDVISEFFVMIEVGSGPFLPNSTTYMFSEV